jgi:predicted metalloprotease with PDZ domain
MSRTAVSDLGARVTLALVLFYKRCHAAQLRRSIVVHADARARGVTAAPGEPAIVPAVVRGAVAAVLLAGLVATSASAQTPVQYVLTLPEPEHRWMQVQVTFSEVPPGPLQVRMSRTSPGRYALHEFAKNVFDVRVRDGSGRELIPSQPNLHQWDVAGHDGTVVVTYRIFGDRVDGTYLGIDSTHAHVNKPATLMWARGLENRGAEVRFEQPAGRQWRVATQLYPTADPLTFTAPNFHYLMDSPSEFSAFTERRFTVSDGRGSIVPVFRVALHHDGTDEEADAFARDTETIVRETLAIFGEFPQFEGNTYTFISDYLPWASGDGMEHRNSTVLTSPGALRSPAQRVGILGTVAHEFFHAWNMERIRAASIEPFDFEDANVSTELWFGEGFTSYYDTLIMHRAGLAPLEQTLASFMSSVNTVVLSPGRQLRSPEEMSRRAPFVDAAAAIDRTAWENTFVSYYTYGDALGLALDLSLRGRSDGRVSLDTYMRAMWTKHGRPGQKVPGMVATPYTTEDLQAVLAEVSGDPQFAADFFGRFIRGREAPDYAPLLSRAGLVMRQRAAGKAALVGVQQLNFTGAGGARVTTAVLFGSPLYKAGVARDDLIVSLDGVAVASQAALDAALGKRKPGDAVPIRFVRRSGETVEATVVLEEDPRVDVIPVEQAGGTLSEAQKRFRAEWLSPQR